MRAVLLEPPRDAMTRPVRPPSRATAVIRSGIEWAAMVALLALAGQLVLQSRIVKGSSMAPTLLDGERVLVSRWAYAGSRRPQRGDVVVFKAWQRLEDPFDPRLAESEDFVKRVVGVPGETIAVLGGRVIVDGIALDEPADYGQTVGAVEPITLGPGEYFVLGDNRANSSDSRLFGRLDEAAIVGRAWARFWPPGSAGLIRGFDARRTAVDDGQLGVSGPIEPIRDGRHIAPIRDGRPIAPRLP